MRNAWGVYCTDGHACIGPYDTELEALLAAQEMMEVERATTGDLACIYNAIPMMLREEMDGMDKTPPDDRPGGLYL